MDGEHEELSPIITIFERLSFERGHDVHDYVSSMVDYFSSTDINLEMLDILIECIKICFVHSELHKTTRIIDFLTNLTHVAFINFNVNKNLALVFEALFDVYCQMMIATDSRIRQLTFRLLNQIDLFIDLVRLPVLSENFQLILLDLVKNENTKNVLDQIIPLASKFQVKNHRFIDAFLYRIQTMDKQNEMLKLLHYSPSVMRYLSSNIEQHNDLFHISFETLLDIERGFTFDRLDNQTRVVLLNEASKSHELSRLIILRWSQQHDLIELIEIFKPWAYYESQSHINKMTLIEQVFYNFFNDIHQQEILVDRLRSVIGSTKGGLLPATIDHYSEYLFLWRLSCQLITDDDEHWNPHPDFHEFLSYFYRLIKSSIDRSLSTMETYVLCQHATILSNFEILDMYRRKCLEAISRCLLIHFGHYPIIIEYALRLIDLVFPSKVENNSQYQILISILNDLIQRCHSSDNELYTFLQCINIIHIFIQHIQKFDENQHDFKVLIYSLIRSGINHNQNEIKHQTLLTLHTLTSYSSSMAIDFIRDIFNMLETTNDQRLRKMCLFIFLDNILCHSIDILQCLNFETSFLEMFLMKWSTDRSMKTIVIQRLMMLILSNRILPTLKLIQIILNTSFANEDRSIDEQRCFIHFFYFYIHASSSNVQLMEQLTIHLIAHSLPFIADRTTFQYRSIEIESMCFFCLELLSLSTLPNETFDRKHSHYLIAKHLLDSIHESPSYQTHAIIKSYFTVLKHLSFEYLSEDELKTLLELLLRLRQNGELSINVEKLVKSIGKFLDKSSFDRKRSHSPSDHFTGSHIKRKLNSSRFLSLDFETNSID